MTDLQVYSVSQISNIIKSRFDNDTLFSKICVVGEISNYKVYPSGHHYFSLKDECASISCVMFKGSASYLRFDPENGMSILAMGKISSYPRDGKYQLYCDKLEPFGAGDLQAKFEQLKEKLLKEGLFDSVHKKPLPKFPEKVCVITSSAGAAIHDIIRIMNKRWPMSEIRIIPVRVQGTEAPGEIVQAIKYANTISAGDVIILGRGGGSTEDLWAFNDETVARAIYSSDIPIISAVGHEPDITISDYVADFRAATPSNGAECAVPDCEEIREILEGYKIRLDYRNFINNLRIDLDRTRDKLASRMDRFMSQKKQEFLKQASYLDAMSPLKVLTRGYSVVLKNKNTVTQSRELSAGDKIDILLAEGSAECTVDEVMN